MPNLFQMDRNHQPQLLNNIQPNFINPEQMNEQYPLNMNLETNNQDLYNQNRNYNNYNNQNSRNMNQMSGNFHSNQNNNTRNMVNKGKFDNNRKYKGKSNMVYSENKTRIYDEINVI